MHVPVELQLPYEQATPVGLHRAPPRSDSPSAVIVTERRSGADRRPAVHADARRLALGRPDDGRRSAGEERGRRGLRRGTSPAVALSAPARAASRTTLVHSMRCSIRRAVSARVTGMNGHRTNAGTEHRTTTRSGSMATIAIATRAGSDRPPAWRWMGEGRNIFHLPVAVRWWAGGRFAGVDRDGATRGVRLPVRSRRTRAQSASW